MAKKSELRQKRIESYQKTYYEIWDRRWQSNESYETLDKELAYLRTKAIDSGDEDYSLFFEAAQIKHKHAFENVPSLVPCGKDAEETLSLIEKAIAWQKRHKYSTDFFLLYQKGSALSDTGQHEEAVKCLNEFLEVFPKHYHALNCIGISLRNLKQYDKAIHSLGMAIVVDPQKFYAYINLGLVLSEQKRWDLAIERFDCAVEICSNFLEAILQKGHAFLSMGDHDSAIECFDVVIESEQLAPCANIYKGCCLLEKMEYDEAINCLKASSEKFSECHLVYRWMGDAYFEREDYNDAISCYKIAIELYEKAMDSTNAFDICTELCHCCAQQASAHCQFQQFEKAILCYEDLLKREDLPEHIRFCAEKSCSLIKNLKVYSESEELSHAFLSKFDKYLKIKEGSENIFREKIFRPSRFHPKYSFFLFLRRWNSFTPAIPAHQADSIGGGYFLWHKGEGTVIDPGYNFLENFHRAGGSIRDIDNVFITHSHDDHTHQLEQILTLLYKYNDEIPKETKRIENLIKRIKGIQESGYVSNGEIEEFELREYLDDDSEKIDEKAKLSREGMEKLSRDISFLEKRLKNIPTPHKANFYLNNGTFKKYGGLFDLKDHNYIKHVYTLNAGAKQNIAGGEVEALTAYHDEVVSLDQAVGLLFTLKDRGNKHTILLTSDTGLFPRNGETKGEPKEKMRNKAKYLILPRVYQKAHRIGKGEIDLMVIHIGSIKETERELVANKWTEQPTLDELFDSCYKNHLGYLGTRKLLYQMIPKVAVLSEWGEEMRNFRIPLVCDLQRYIGDVTKVLPSDIPLIYRFFAEDQKEPRLIWDCVNEKWVPAENIQFADSGEVADHTIFFMKPDENGKTRFENHESEIGNWVDLNNSLRKHRRGMYFKPETETSEESPLP